MPDIYDYFGIIFYFWSDEHDPIHLHVEYQGRGCVIYLWKDGRITVRRMSGMRLLDARTINTAYKLVKRKQNAIRQKWSDFHVFGKKVKLERITRRIV